MNAKLLTQKYLGGERDFKGLKLHGLDLSGAHLSDGDFSDGDFSDGDFSHAAFRNAAFRNAAFRNADLSYVDFIGANLSYVDFIGANLIGADLINANLTGANLTGANLRVSDLHGVTLNGARGIACAYAPWLSSRGDYLYAQMHRDGVGIKAGCFYDTSDNFAESVNDSAKTEASQAMYLVFARALEVQLLRSEDRNNEALDAAKKLLLEAERLVNSLKDENQNK